MKKPLLQKLTAFVTVICLLFSLSAYAITPPTADTAQEISVYINGEKLNLNPPAVVENGRTLIPLRQIFESLDATVEWSGAQKTITAIRGGTTIKLQIDYNKIAIGSRGIVQYVPIDVAPKIIGASTFVPLRTIAQSFGAQVDWDSATKTVTITTTPDDTKIYDGHADINGYVSNYIGAVYYVGTNAIKFPAYNEYIQPLLPSEITGTNHLKGNILEGVSPHTTGIAATDEIIDEILAGIITPAMTDKDKIKAAYDYLIYNLSHNNNYSANPDLLSLRKYVHGVQLYSSEGGAALSLLYTKEGVCDHFAALFTCMMWRLGHDSQVVGGLYINRDGSSYPHAWSVVTLDGIDYYFDPDIESSLYDRGIAPSYFLFMQTEAQCRTNHAW